ncbi:hypothetical protein TTHERM_00471910 (macronuclear) [Tetrahymena thermophila SB210]|uniref:Uncharacterized protein n=1 Tax=Tetrahymena thermophila (strain SB210) TaxID=312017 RepID=I7M035_TETTS|nr:hypothetical protein TTHERM_00471910 [Tetrahymena thermophila SB210]EAR85412.2 hypothetical protein TTHERM_00471910 [Tetrahymena thermophila SB210]|eukprot:XP_001033075.2 hypothetical protein TTHERM_00471910 [Tetrahymena thermophila SB210]
MKDNSQKENDNYFEHPIYCSQIISNNACFHEIKKLINQIEIFYDFPYSKQLFFVSNIDEITSEIVEFEEVQQFYKGSNKESYLEKCKMAQRNLHAQNLNQNCWRKIKIDYFIEENGKKQYLSEYQVIRKDQILEHVNKKRNQSQVGKDSRSESQNDETDNHNENGEIDVIDGIYYFSDFLEKKKPDNSNIQDKNSSQNKNSPEYKLAQYIEKIFDQFNKSVIYSFLSYFLSQCILILLNKKMLIDIDISNLILIRENQNIKFVYLISFEDFKLQLEEKLMQSINNSNETQMTYEQFCDTFYFIEKQNDSKKKIQLNERAQKKIGDFLKNIAYALLNDYDLKEAKDDSEFANQCITGVQDIEEAISQQDVRKRYCKVLITKNQLLTAIINSMNSNEKTYKIFLELYKRELENFNKLQSNNTQQENLTQSEIINSFFQDYLKKAGSFPDNQRPVSQEETFIEFCCEEYPRQQNSISIMNNNLVQREKTKTPKFINDSSPDHEIAAISSQKREMQLQLKIKEFKRGVEENQKRQELDKLKMKKQNEIQDPKKHMEEIKKIEQYLHSIPSIRGGEKKLMIDFKESTCSLLIKLYYQQELFAQPENIDEMLYCIQLLNNSFNDISIYMDEHKRICFETHVCIGQKEKVLLRAIFMIDSLITYGLTFYDFYYQSMINSKQSKDIQKYIQLQQEIQQYLDAYKLKYDNFVLFLNKQV